MNKFVRQYILLPFCFLFVLFPLLFFTACACQTVSSGSEIKTNVVYINPVSKKEEELPAHNKNVFNRLLLQVNQKWFFNQNLKKRSALQKYLENQLQKEFNPIIKSFVDVAFYSSKNSRYHKAKFVSKKREKQKIGKKNFFWASEFLKKNNAENRKLKFYLWFQNAKKNEHWKLTLQIENLTIKKDGLFDIGDKFNVQIEKSNVLMPNQPKTK